MKLGLASLSLLMIMACSSVHPDRDSTPITGEASGISGVRDQKAVQEVIEKVAASRKLLGQGKGPFDFSTVGRLYQSLLKIDVSACPADFRAQYWRVVESVRQFRDAIEKSGDLEVTAQQAVKETGELKAIARKYGAATDFDSAFPVR